VLQYARRCCGARGGRPVAAGSFSQPPSWMRSETHQVARLLLGGRKTIYGACAGRHARLVWLVAVGGGRQAREEPFAFPGCLPFGKRRAQAAVAAPVSEASPFDDADECPSCDAVTAGLARGFPRFSPLACCGGCCAGPPTQAGTCDGAEVAEGFSGASNEAVFEGSHKAEPAGTPLVDQPPQGAFIAVFPGNQCPLCGHRGLILDKRGEAAKVVCTSGAVNVTHYKKRCGARDCRKYISANYSMSGGIKRNVVDSAPDILMLTGGFGFSLPYLNKFIASCMLGSSSLRSEIRAFEDVLTPTGFSDKWFREQLSTAMFYLLRLKDLGGSAEKDLYPATTYDERRSFDITKAVELHFPKTSH